MYCPNCAAPIDGVKFCRQCGTNVSLVPQALTGQLPAPAPTEAAQMVAQTEPEALPSMSHVFNQVLFGLGFLAAAAIVSRNAAWGWVFIFPAMGAFGKAVSEYYRVAEAHQRARQQPAFPSFQPVISQPHVQVPTTSELKLPATATPVAQPTSVTEHTTALLDAARQKSVEKN